MPPRAKTQTLVSSLLAWYVREGRDLPWRVRGRCHPDAYHVLLSEVMLQQTTVAAVIPYYRLFLSRWPDVAALAAARDGDVMQAWAGLGYYARARNLLRATREICQVHGGTFPRTSADLEKLPGVGPYTAAAVAAIAFGERVLPLDANIARVSARLLGFREALPAGMPKLRALAQVLCPRAEAADFCQAMMDLGSMVCTPRAPACGMCPILSFCKSGKAGDAELLPLRAAGRQKPVEHGVFYLLRDAEGRGMVRRRPDRGIWGGLLEVPSSGWRGAIPLPDGMLDAVDWEDGGHFRHAFTHFSLEMEWRLGSFSGKGEKLGFSDVSFLPLPELVRAGVPSPIAKALRRIAGP